MGGRSIGRSRNEGTLARVAELRSRYKEASVVGKRMSGPQWRKSSESGTDACVEMAVAGPDEVLVRDSKNPAGPVLRYNAREWTAFLAGVRAGEFDLEG
jgi:hypothetical protein